MEAIKEAIARRKAGGGESALGTQGAPTGNTPTGGPNTPTVQAPAAPAPTGQTAPSTMPTPRPPMPAPQSTQGGKPQMKQVANFDDETRGLAKALITKLMGAL